MTSKITGLYRMISFLALAVCMWLHFGTTANAEVEIYTNGMFFDAEFYATTYPEIAAQVGNDEIKLLQHYIDYGEAEGRLPYATYGTGISPVTGVRDVALSKEPITTLDVTDPELNRYLEEALPALWDGKGYEEIFGSHPNGWKISGSERVIKYMPGVDETGYFNSAMLQNHPELGCWYISRDEEGTTWYVRLIRNFKVGGDDGYIIPIEAWDLLRNMLRYFTPDAETIFKNLVSGYYRGFAPSCADYGNFYNIGSTLFMMQDTFGEEYYFRANDSGLDMTALHNAVPSDTAGQVPLATAKRTSIDVNDPALNAYVAAYDQLANPTKTGMNMSKMTTENLLTLMLTEGESSLLLFDDSITSAGCYGVEDYWILQYDLSSMYEYPLESIPGVKSSWGLAIPGYLDKQETDAVHQALRYVSPDGDALYAKILQNETAGTLALNKWIKVGSSQLYVTYYGDGDLGKYHENVDLFYMYVFR